MAKSRLKHHLKIGFGKVLGSIWEGSGRDRDVSWALLGASWPYFWHSRANFFKALVQDRLQEAFWIDFGSILGGFGEGLGGSGEGFGRIWKLLATIWKDLKEFGESCGRVSNWTPALIRSASQCAGVPPSVVRSLA